MNVLQSFYGGNARLLLTLYWLFGAPKPPQRIASRSISDSSLTTFACGYAQIGTASQGVTGLRDIGSLCTCHTLQRGGASLFLDYLKPDGLYDYD